MKFILLATVFCLSSFSTVGTHASCTTDDNSKEPVPVYPIPSAQQLEWQKTELYAFFHYGMNTFKNREWGLGNEKPKEYAPLTVPDCRQWVRAVKQAGMRGAVFVAKHHDGFCMWPTATTSHSVLNSSAAGKNTDIMLLASEACKEYNMKMGVYLSPWDRNNKTYGTREYADNLYLRQLHEVCTSYGALFEIWFDGANGGTGYYGGDTAITITIDNPTYYNWQLMHDTVRSMQPTAVAGRMDFRWGGNEEGFAGVTNWSPIAKDDAMREKNLAMGNENGNSWIPVESDAKATDSGWFWHENEKVLPAERLFQMYLETVGRNATFILNIPPSTAGILPQASVDTLARLGTLLRTRFAHNLALDARIKATHTRKKTAQRSFVAANLADGNYDTYWATPDDVSAASVTLEWKKPRTMHYVVLQEYIPLGQRIRKFRISTSLDGKTWTPCAKRITTTIGYKRIIPLNGSTEKYGEATTARFVKVDIIDSKACIVMNNIAVY